MYSNKHTFIDILSITISDLASLTALDSFLDFYDTPRLASRRGHYPPPLSGYRIPKLAPLLPIGQLHLTISTREGEGAIFKSFGDYMTWWLKLERMGLRPFWESTRGGSGAGVSEFIEVKLFVPLLLVYLLIQLVYHSIPS